MPLYQYACTACGASFEELVRSQDERVRCPVCQAARVERAPAVFAVKHGRSAESPPPDPSCGRCGDPRGPGACALDD